MSEKRETLEGVNVSSRKTRVIGRKLHCLNPNPQRWNLTLAATTSLMQRHQGRTVRLLRCVPSPDGR